MNVNKIFKRKEFLVILAITVIVLASYANFQSGTIISISSINVEPNGSIVGDEYRGSFWNILAYINANDQLAGVVLPEGQTGSITYQGALKALETGAKVEVKIDPGTPYIIRDIQEKVATVAPSAIGGGQTKTAFYVNYYGWSEPTWRIYTPFTISVYKDGSLVGQATLNMQGQSQVQTITTTEGSVRIENLGILGGSYLAPNTPSQIAILKGYSNVYDFTQIATLIDGSQAGSIAGSGGTKYSDYWYGTARDSSNRAYNPTVAIGTGITNVYRPSAYGGWAGSDYGGQATPVKPVIGSSDKSTLPAEERSYYCLTEFIESKNIANLAQSIFNTRATGNSGALWQSASFVTDTNGATALKLEIPWSAFGTPLVNIRIPTELADTWVEQPAVANAQVSAVWDFNGNQNIDISGASRIKCTVTNTGTVTASTRLTIQSGNSKLAVTPLEMTVNNLVPNVPQTVYFDATNLGVETQINNVPITIIASDTYTGSETGRTTLYGTLLATLNTGTTVFNVHVVEKGTSNAIVGLQLNVQYASESPIVFTDGNGNVGLTLAMPQGGAYTGQVFVQSADTPVYKSSAATYTCNTPTIYNFTLEVERKDSDPGLDWSWLLWLILPIAVAVVGVYLSKRKKRKT